MKAPKKIVLKMLKHKNSKGEASITPPFEYFQKKTIKIYQICKKSCKTFISMHHSSYRPTFMHVE